MVKSLFVEGNLNHNEGEGRLEIISTKDELINRRVNDSLRAIANVVGFYDFGKLEDSDYYYFFKKYGINKNIQSEEEVKTMVKGLVESGDSGLTIGTENERDMFLDINNNIIITRGEKNARTISIELLMLSYVYLNQEWNKEIEREKIKKAVDVPVIVKTHKLDMQEQIEMTSSKPIKLFYN